MNSDAWSVMREIDPWTVVLIVLGVLFAVREVKELFNDLTKSFGIERKSDIEKKELKDSITNRIQLLIFPRKLKISIIKSMFDLIRCKVIWIM